MSLTNVNAMLLGLGNVKLFSFLFFLIIGIVNSEVFFFYYCLVCLDLNCVVSQSVFLPLGGSRLLPGL